MRLAYVVGTYPQPSETFIAREVEGMRARGHTIDVFSLFAPAEGPQAGVTYGWVTPTERALRMVQGIKPVVQRWRAAFADAGYDAIMAHFGSQPSTVALEAAGEWPLFLSLHARDLYVEAERLEEKLARARAVLTCTQANVDYLRDKFPAHARKVHLIYHGVPQAWLDAPIPERLRTSTEPLRLLAVGRLVPKKGFDVLLDACTQMEIPTALRIIGDGPLRGKLKMKAEGETDFPGWVSQHELHKAYAWADVFCCPSVQTKDGDRDGLPNVLTEAMATGLVAVGSRLSGIPEAIVDGGTGFLVPPGNAGALAAAITRCADPSLRTQFGAAAAARARDHFHGPRWLDRLENLLIGHL